ncbi:DNA cross-link repair 1A protein, partial [Tremellales sp. Uapishka_1]
MARANKKAKTSPSPGAGLHSTNLLNFFSKTPRIADARDRGDAKLYKGKGKAKAKEVLGSIGAPVVISDDDEEATPSTKRRKISVTVPKVKPKARVLDFKPSAHWPEIINTVNDEEDDKEEEDVPDGVYEESIPGDCRMEDPENHEDEDDVPVEVIPPETPDVGEHEENPLGAGSHPLDLGAEWDEGDDEGMGMDEEDEDEELRTPMTASSKNGSSKADQHSVAMAECPICRVSLKGKVNTIRQHHINTCLDSSSRPKKPSQPIGITSISHSVVLDDDEADEEEEEEIVKGPNAFSVLMSGHKEVAQWRDAEVDLKRDGKRSVGRRKAPFYKVLTGMPVAVDAFRYGAIPKVKAYLLTHAHSDHYTNLSKSWKHGPIYCSETTANLIVHMLGVEPQWVHGLPDNIPFEMPNTGGVTVTPIEANHCPGSSVFLFEGKQTVNAGDAINFKSPYYCFPPQPLVIQACSSLARKLVVGLPDSAPPIPDSKPSIDDKDGVKSESTDPEEAQERAQQLMQSWLVKKESKNDVKDELVELPEKKKGRTLVVVGTYSIGKERIVKGIARALGSKIYCDTRKRGILLCEADPELHSMLTADPIEAQVHLVPLGNIQLDRLQPYLHRLLPHFDRVLGFRPTGWTYTPPAGTNTLPDVNTVMKRDQSRGFSESGLKPMRGSSRNYMMYGVPYSEHSSFFELTCFALSLPGADLKMIATVNVGNEKSRGKMKKWFEKWAAEKAKRKQNGLPSTVEYRDENYSRLRGVTASRTELTSLSKISKSINAHMVATPVISLHHLLMANSLLLNPLATKTTSNIRQVPPSSSKLLSTLQERLTRFRNFRPRQTNSFTFHEPSGRLYEYLEGILMRGVGDRLSLPSEVAIYDLRKIDEWEDLEEKVEEAGGDGDEDEDEEITESEAEKGLKTTKRFGFQIADFAVDPGMDLLILVEIRTDNEARTHSMHFHLYSLSTFQPHPKAKNPVIKWPIPLRRRDVSLGFQICDDTLVVLHHNGRGGVRDFLNGYDWPTGRHIMTLRAPNIMSFESFILLSPTSFVMPTIITHLDPLSSVMEELANTDDLSWSHHLHLYAFPPTPPPNASEPDPPAHTATHIATLDLPDFYINIDGDIPPPRLTIRTDPPPRQDFPTHPTGNVSLFQPTPESGMIVMEIFCQMPGEPDPHYVMCMLKSTLLSYLPAPTSPLLKQAFPRPAPVVPWESLAPKVRLFGPDMDPQNWVCYVYQNRYVAVRTDDMGTSHLQLYDFDPLRVRKEIVERSNLPQPPKKKSLLKRMTSRDRSDHESGFTSWLRPLQTSTAPSVEGDHMGVKLVTAETVLSNRRPLKSVVVTGRDLPYLLVEKQTVADVVVIDGERIVAIQTADQMGLFAEAMPGEIEVMDF